MFLPPHPRPQLLVSVRNAHEAHDALSGGANVIDVKEPARGPLGRADAEVVAEIAAAIEGRRPATAAAGDLGELTPGELRDWAKRGRAELIKVGIGSELSPAVIERIGRLASWLPRGQLVPVLYVDRVAGRLPGAQPLGQLARDAKAQWVVLDTYDKRGRDLLDACGMDELAGMLARARKAGLRVCLAGSLRGESLTKVAELAPELIGVRGAACSGTRNAPIDAQRIANLQQLLHAACKARETVSSKFA